MYWINLIGLRGLEGLSEHAEMGHKTLLLKFNTGPSRYGTPAVVGMIMVLMIILSANLFISE